MRFLCSACRTILTGEPGQDVECRLCKTMCKAPAGPTAAGAVIGDFAIVRELARGGMGIVYLARQISLDRLVALKILQDSYAADAQFVDDFIREARAAARISHPNIVQAYAVGEENGIYYFAMELLDGETMKSVLKKEQRIQPRRAAEIICSIADALDYAWTEQKIVHQDIKPDNIMLTPKGLAKLADLGLSRIATDSNNLAEDEVEVMGTPQYISPEQLTGIQTDIRSDIYSLGATFYHFVTGEFPYKGKDGDEIARQHVEGTLIPPIEKVPDLPPELNRIIIKMMSKTLEGRYQSGAELVSDLKNFLSGNTAKKSDDAAAPKASTPAPAAAPKINAPAVTPAAPKINAPAVTPAAPKINVPAVTPAAPKINAPAVTPAAPKINAPAVTPAAPKINAPAVPKINAPAVPKINAPAVPKINAPAAAPAVPKINAPAAAPAVPKVNTPAAAPAATPATPAATPAADKKEEKAEKPKLQIKKAEEDKAQKEGQTPAKKTKIALPKWAKLTIFGVIGTFAVAVIVLAALIYFRKMPEFMKPLEKQVFAILNLSEQDGKLVRGTPSAPVAQTPAVRKTVPQTPQAPPPPPKPKTRQEFVREYQALMQLANQGDIEKFLNGTDEFMLKYPVTQTQEEKDIRTNLLHAYAANDEILRVSTYRMEAREKWEAAQLAKLEIAAKKKAEEQQRKARADRFAAEQKKKLEQELRDAEAEKAAALAQLKPRVDAYVAQKKQECIALAGAFFSELGNADSARWQTCRTAAMTTGVVPPDVQPAEKAAALAAKMFVRSLDAEFAMAGALKKLLDDPQVRNKIQVEVRKQLTQLDRLEKPAKAFVRNAFEDKTFSLDLHKDKTRQRLLEKMLANAKIAAVYAKIPPKQRIMLISDHLSLIMEDFPYLLQHASGNRKAGFSKLLEAYFACRWKNSSAEEKAELQKSFGTMQEFQKAAK